MQRVTAMRLACYLIATGLVLSVVSVAAAGNPKDQFTLLNPTPSTLMREMYTDRPDKTEVPFTVDAGHVQTESDVFSYVYDDEDGTRTNAWAVFPTNIRIGVLNNTEFGIIIEPYLHE